MKTLTPELELLVLKACENPHERTAIFNEIGQKFLKPFYDDELQETLFAIFQYLCDNEDKWKSQLMLPLYYRSNKEKNVFRDIWFTVRDYIGWCILYPDEVNKYFKMDETGQVQFLATPKVRLVELDNKKDVYKSEMGKQVLVQVNKPRSTVIKSGFTLGQKDGIITVYLVGLLQKPPGFKKPVEKKVYSAQQKMHSKALIKEAVKTEKAKLMLKEVNDLSLALLERLSPEKKELTLVDAQDELSDYLKGKNE